MVIKPHILYICSLDKLHLLQQSLISLEMNSKISFFATIILTNLDGKATVDINWFKERYETILQNVSYIDHPPLRWFVNIKSKVVIFLDYDMICFYNIRELIDICLKHKALCGVLAFDPPDFKGSLKKIFDIMNIKYIESKKTSISNLSIPKYYNYGILVMPYFILRKIRERLKNNILKLNHITKNDEFKSVKFFVGQIALCTTLEQLKIPTIDLPLNFNFPDLHYFEGKIQKEKFNNIIFYHAITKNMKKNLIFI